jgi:hypothetical protein
VGGVRVREESAPAEEVFALVRLLFERFSFASTLSLPSLRLLRYIIIVSRLYDRDTVRIRISNADTYTRCIYIYIYTHTIVVDPGACSDPRSSIGHRPNAGTISVCGVHGGRVRVVRTRVRFTYVFASEACTFTGKSFGGVYVHTYITIHYIRIGVFTVCTHYQETSASLSPVIPLGPSILRPGAYRQSNILFK